MELEKVKYYKNSKNLETKTVYINMDVVTTLDDEPNRKNESDGKSGLLKVLNGEFHYEYLLPCDEVKRLLKKYYKPNQD